MKRKPTGRFPNLRAGCYPQKDKPHPPHKRHNLPDALRITWLVQYTGPVVVNTSGKLWTRDNKPAWELCTENGWRLYLADDENGNKLLFDFLELASAGLGGVQHWMRGNPWEHCIHYALDQWERKEEQDQARHQRAQSSSSTNPQTSILDELLGENPDE